MRRADDARLLRAAPAEPACGASPSMASFAAIQAVGKSMERVLQMHFREEDPVDGPKKTKVLLVRTEELEDPNSLIGRPALTLYLYRVDLNRVMRPAWSAVGHMDGRGHLPLDLHFLLTAWGDNPEDEYRIIGKTMECLEAMPILSGPLLYESADWAPNEGIQLVIDDITTEALMRTFDSLPADYKLSVPYLARVVRVDTRQLATDVPVTTVVKGTVPSVKP
jgi:hypothetical protein